MHIIPFRLSRLYLGLGLFYKSESLWIQYTVVTPAPSLMRPVIKEEVQFNQLCWINKHKSSCYYAPLLQHCGYLKNLYLFVISMYMETIFMVSH